MKDDKPTIGLLSYKIDDVQKSVNKLERLIREGYVTKSEHNHMNRRLLKVERMGEKVAWLIISSVIIGLLGLLFVAR